MIDWLIFAVVMAACVAALMVCWVVALVWLLFRAIEPDRDIEEDPPGRWHRVQ